MTSAHDTQALADRAIVATYEKLHAGKLGAHWLWCVIEQIAAGVPEAQAFKSYGYYEAGPSRARWDASRLQEQEGLRPGSVVMLPAAYSGKERGAWMDGFEKGRATLAAGSQAVHVPGWKDLTDEDRDRAFNTLPDMLDGFMKKWGWLHFAKAIEAICREKNAAPLQPLAGGEVGNG